jgi:hypothetical protein
MSRSPRRSLGEDLLGDMRWGDDSRGTTYGLYGLGEDKGSSDIVDTKVGDEGGDEESGCTLTWEEEISAIFNSTKRNYFAQDDDEYEATEEAED